MHRTGQNGISLGAAAIAFAVFASACRSEASVAANEQAIRDADERYNAAIVQHDLDKIMGIYAPNAVSMSPGDPPAHGLDEIRAAWKRLLATPGYKLRVIPEKIDVARAGDMALELGHNDVEGML
jgi:ketosteroid isomerase-like protein